MDEKLVELLEGIGILSEKDEGFDNAYCKYRKAVIESNKALTDVINQNIHLSVKDAQMELSHWELANQDTIDEPLFKIDSDFYSIHDSVRWMLYAYCLNKVANSVNEMADRASRLKISRVNFQDNQFYYSIRLLSAVEDALYNNLELPKTLWEIIKRNLFFEISAGDGYIIDFNSIKEHTTILTNKFRVEAIRFDLN